MTPAARSTSPDTRGGQLLREKNDLAWRGVDTSEVDSLSHPRHDCRSAGESGGTGAAAGREYGAIVVVWRWGRRWVEAGVSGSDADAVASTQPEPGHLRRTLPHSEKGVPAVVDTPPK